jgi:hypothetical protein
LLDAGYKLCRKLKEFKAILKSKTTSCFGNLRNKIIQARESLDLAQKAVIDSRGRADCLLKERECLHAYVSITKAEEAFLKQKSRNQWLQLGDQNNAVFHRILKGRQVRNSISFLYDELGNKVEDIAQLKSMALEFYRNLLGSKNTHFTDASAERVKQLISPIVPIEEATLLERDVTAEEIKKTIFSMKSNKAPGPDGYTAEFYKSSWHIVGGDVIEAIQNFFRTGLLLKEVNATILTLVPKKPNASVMGDFRPIACCNVLYKCITKILSNRMLPFLDSLISRNQSAFVPSRCISENILLAQELVQNYHRSGGRPWCTMKVNLMKVYDSVDWNFIVQCLSCFGLPTRFTNWIKMCITSPRFTISLNGTLVEYFKGGKGLRQCDHLSIYLFVLVMEVFSRLMKEYTRE